MLAAGRMMSVYLTDPKTGETVLVYRCFPAGIVPGEIDTVQRRPGKEGMKAFHSAPAGEIHILELPETAVLRVRVQTQNGEHVDHFHPAHEVVAFMDWAPSGPTPGFTPGHETELVSKGEVWIPKFVTSDPEVGRLLAEGMNDE